LLSLPQDKEHFYDRCGHLPDNSLHDGVDDFCTLSLSPEPHPGPQAAISRSEVVTLALFAQWQGVGSERGFYRDAQCHLRPAFPALPTAGAIQSAGPPAARRPGRIFSASRPALGGPAVPVRSSRQLRYPHAGCQAPWRGLVARPGGYWLERPAGLV